jgi:hypothetical protein
MAAFGFGRSWCFAHSSLTCCCKRGPRVFEPVLRVAFKADHALTKQLVSEPDAVSTPNTAIPAIAMDTSCGSTCTIPTS